MTRNRTARLVATTSAVLLALVVPSLAFAAATSGYAGWTSGGPGDTPHRGYGITTTKCAVCHAVHKGSASGQILLHEPAADVCVYCHITTNIGEVQIYAADPDLYYADNKKNHSAEGGAPCNGCHSVHGSDIFEGEMTVKILRKLPVEQKLLDYLGATNDDVYAGSFPYADSGTVYGAPPYDWEDMGSTRLMQQTAFCSGCHPYFTHASEDYITSERMVLDDGTISTDPYTFASHPMKRYWNDAGGGTAFEAEGTNLDPDIQVAFMSTQGCYRCHGEGDYTNQGAGTWASDFPHYTENRERFLISSDEDGNWIDTENSSEDGQCFHCHRDGAGNGVGLTY